MGSHLPPRLRIILVDDQPLFRKALASLIDSQPDMQVVARGRERPGGARPAAEARARPAGDGRPDARRGSGADGVNAIRSAGFTTPIVMLTVSEDDDDLFESIKAGANGYLLKNVKPEQLFEDLRGVMRGEAPIAPAVASKLLDALRTGGIPARGGVRRSGARGHRADPPRERGPPAGGRGHVQQGDRQRADDHRGHGQEPRPQRPGEAPPDQPGRRPLRTPCGRATRTRSRRTGGDPGGGLATATCARPRARPPSATRHPGCRCAIRPPEPRPAQAPAEPSITSGAIARLELAAPGPGARQARPGYAPADHEA